MLMIVMSLVISLASIQAFHSLVQETSSDAAPKPQRVSQESKSAIHPEGPLTGRRPIELNPLALPPGERAWTIQIVSSGGFTGSDRKDLTLTSDGLLTWSGPDGSCSRRLANEVMQPITKIVLAANAPAAGCESSTSMMCFDCYLTTMLLQRRRAEGVVSAVVVSWDDASQAQISADMVSIYNAAIANKGCNLQGQNSEPR